MWRNIWMSEKKACEAHAAGNKIHRIFFSPTGTSQAVVEAICSGASNPIGMTVDLSHSSGEPFEFAKEDLVVVAMPVYGGSLPALARERFASLRGKDTPVVAVVVYGNRAYGDALLELCDLCCAQGFSPVGAAAFIGEHSFSCPEFPIAENRPDAADLKMAEEIGRRLAGCREPLDLHNVPGERPGKAAMAMPGAAAASDPETCSHCGACIAACPSGAIAFGANQIPETDAAQCIWCMACTRSCPEHARVLVLPKIKEIADRLNQTCKERREPEWFAV
jgi:ferredoxin/flavodoxin